MSQKAQMLVVLGMMVFFSSVQLYWNAPKYLAVKNFVVFSRVCCQMGVLGMHALHLRR